MNKWSVESTCQISDKWIPLFVSSGVDTHMEKLLVTKTVLGV